MQKYAFLVYHRAYDGFLKGLQELGVLHVQKREEEPPEALLHLRQQQKQIAEVVHFLTQREITPSAPAAGDAAGGLAIAQAVRTLREEQERDRQRLQVLHKELAQLTPWGEFSAQELDRLEEAGLKVHFFVCPEKKFDPAWKEQYYLEVISTHPPDLYFIVLTRGVEPLAIPAEEIRPPERDPAGVRSQLSALQTRLEDLNRRLDEHAARDLPAIQKSLQALEEEGDLLDVIANTRREAGEAVMVLEGFVPKPNVPDLERFCRQQSVVCLAGRPTPEDAPPVLLRNNQFSRLFEPIGGLFALPAYHELDLTPFFAPFFMLFFGFCLGDAGYGLVVLLGATLYKRRANADLRPVLTLAQYLGLATIIFGALTGTVFGLNLLQDQFAGLGELRRFMINSDQAFQLALILGMVQILFGLCLQAANRWRQFGFAYAVPVFGWLLLLLSLLDVAYLKLLSPASTYTAWAGVGLILLFNDPSANIFARIGKGIWELYGLTGIFGDLLSYIRLFALGISSAILGFVINDIALQVRDAIPWLGPVLFVLFLVVGHTANLLISSLGSFVHPMRLTFVEFYKNAGFVGGGKAYKPFAKREELKSEVGSRKSEVA